MKRLDALGLQERLRSSEPAVVSVLRRRGTASSDELLRRLDLATTRAGIELFTADADDAEVAPLLPDLGIEVLPAVLILAGGTVVEQVNVVRDGVDARRLVALATGARRV